MKKLPIATEESLNMLTQEQLEHVVIGYVKSRPDGATEEEIAKFIQRVEDAYVFSLLIESVVEGQLYAGWDKLANDWVFYSREALDGQLR